MALRKEGRLGGLFAILILPLLLYCGVQTGRDVRQRHWGLGIWGILMVCFILWMLTRLFSGAQH